MRQIHLSGQYPSGASVAVFSALALEAYPNDLLLIIDQIKDRELPEGVSEAHYILKQLESDRAQLKIKYSLLYYALTGSSLDKGSQIFQDIALLIDIRNQIVHFKPTVSEFIPGEMDRPEALKKLLHRVTRRGIIDRDLINEPDILTQTWTMVLDESDTFVEWALDVVYDTINFYHESIPDFPLKDSFISMMVPKLPRDQL